MSDILLQQLQDGVCTLTLNRPERKNALSPELVLALSQALEQADARSDVRAIVMTGAGDDEKSAFCAGGDLQGGMQGDGFFAQHQTRAAFANLLLTMARMHTPTIAAVNGTAMGGGFGLVLACDLAVAAQDARMGTPEVKRGLFPMMIAALIDDVVPRKAAMELMLLGGELSGAQAASLHIVNRAVLRSEVRAQATAMAQQLASMSPAVLSLGKRAIGLQRGMALEQKLMFLRDQLTLNLHLDDAAEGIAAFVEKRAPVWKGK
jgi:enoyl-CoA hydratase